jgi:HlyD family secretion protein
MLKRRRVLVSALALTAAVAVSAGVYWKRRSRAPSEEELVSVTRRTIAHTLEITGKIVPVESMVIMPRQSGRIVEIAVKEGAQVKEGDLLFSMRLEAAGQAELLQLRAEVTKLTLDVRAAEQRLADKRPVRELIGSASVLKEENDLERLRLEREAAIERLGVMEADLGLAGGSGATPPPAAGATTAKAGPSARPGKGKASDLVFVTSPRSGIVTLIDKRPGDFVLGGVGGGGSEAAADERLVMVVADMSSLMVRTRVLEADLRYVKPELPVRVKLDAYPDVAYDGRVIRLGGQGRVDSKAGYTYFDVDVAVDQRDARVLPEMNATVELIFAKREGVLALPVGSVVIFPERAFVHVPDDTTEEGFVEKDVKVGVVSETDVEILEGLAENDKVLPIDFAALEIEGGEDQEDGAAPAKGKGKPRTKSGGGGGKRLGGGRS